jgi:alcohol dehydrogenase class IV
MRVAADALGVTEAAPGIFDLVHRLGGPTSLQQLGMPEDGLDRAAHLATEQQYPNPRPIEYGPIRELLERAYRGERPSGLTAAGPRAGPGPSD